MAGVSSEEVPPCGFRRTAALDAGGPGADFAAWRAGRTRVGSRNGLAHLRQALTICQRLGSPRAGHVRETLNHTPQAASCQDTRCAGAEPRRDRVTVDTMAESADSPGSVRIA
jgi:hypothetical protein